MRIKYVSQKLILLLFLLCVYYTAPVTGQNQTSGRDIPIMIIYNSEVTDSEKNKIRNYARSLNQHFYIKTGTCMGRSIDGADVWYLSPITKNNSSQKGRGARNSNTVLGQNGPSGAQVDELTSEDDLIGGNNKLSPENWVLTILQTQEIKLRKNLIEEIKPNEYICP
ncbi:hypothetical protein OAT18_03920 [Tenacibaculum sp.]|nr:hypothetical protein [Tenacibaculum sp.]